MFNLIAMRFIHSGLYSLFLNIIKGWEFHEKILVLQDWYFRGFKSGGPIKCIRNIVNNSKDELSFYILTNNKDFEEKISFKNIKENKYGAR